MLHISFLLHVDSRFGGNDNTKTGSLSKRLTFGNRFLGCLKERNGLLLDCADVTVRECLNLDLKLRPGSGRCLH